MKQKRALRQPHAMLACVLGLLAPLALLLPWIRQGGGSLGGLGLLTASPQVLALRPLAFFGALGFLFSLYALFSKNRNAMRGLAAAAAAGVLAAVYALLTAKATADASLTLAEPFFVSHLGPGLWAFGLLALAALVLSLMALRQPVAYVVLSSMAAVWLVPVAWLLLTAFRQEPGAYTPYVLPRGYTLMNFSRLFTETQQFNFPRWYMNTLIVAVITCLVTTTLVLMISYAFSRLRFPSRKTYMNVGLIISMFPGFMSMIAIYHILKAVGLDQSLVSLILVYSGGGALGYFIAKGFFDTIPRSLDEAATIDGASKNLIFWKIILPSSKPIVVYTAITAFIAPWVDFIFVSVIMKDNYQNYTVALGLFRMLEREHIYEYFTRFCAGAVLVALPITLLFIKIQKFYVEGVTGGAVKG